MIFEEESPQPRKLGVLLFAFIFSSCGHSTADMPFLFVPVQDMTYLFIKGWIV